MTRRPQAKPFSFPHSIEVHIEELVLNGFDPRDRHRIGDAVERELARLLAKEGWSPSLMESVQMDRLDGGAFLVKPPARGEKIGAQVGETVYQTLRKGMPRGK